eukprot:CAMPEP_0183421606 /NCGR_PEP_ID=MMETSP0370-20130417/27223_1 /TAXON_ID=268820 /ORGANISM="Peridinium aciculiferum, Strain PAER-2" /LENGTH=256 /DNA_ID=CAMNT_0025605615 /DNA_START=85 /DNA_END=856 /DNA_ORIENTATION=-
MAFSTSGGFSAAAGSSCFAGDPEDQASWHASFRDASNNMYRTSYTDMSHGKEVCVRSDYPSGYGGHVPSVRHDVLFRNTGFDMETAGRRTDQKRDAFPGFRDQILGIPTTTSCPRGAKKTPTHGIIPHNGTTTMLKPPWGVFTSKSDPLNHRTTPRTTPRGLAASSMLTPRPGALGASLPTPRTFGFGGSTAMYTPRPGSGASRSNEAAMNLAGAMLAPAPGGDTTPMHGDLRPPFVEGPSAADIHDVKPPQTRWV